jgi:tetratricopeptide (TPR) repeat protein
MRLPIIFSLLAVTALVAGCSGKPQTLEELTRAGDKAFTDARFPEARASYQKALLLKPSDRHLLYFTGLTFRREQMYDSALGYLKRADLLHPGDREINLEIRDLARQTQNWRYAIDAIKTLIATGDREEDHYRDLVELYARDSAALMAYYYQKKIIDQQPDSPDEYMRLINVALAVESVTVALEYLDSAVARFGERNEFLANQAFILVYQKNYDGAEQLFRKTIANDSTVLGYRLGLANVLSMSEDRAKLRESLDLYRQIRARLGTDQYNVDSMIAVLEQQVR